ncbi:MAG: hypothetical protein U0223_07495 [Nitrospira sp.]|nr:hypothetical protein [Nitrospira sp.]
MPDKRPPASTQPSINTPSWHLKLLEWEHAPYDGIKGSPPSWIPEPIVREFDMARSSLFFLVEEQQVCYEEIRERFDYCIAHKYGRLALALIRDNKPYNTALDYLARIFNAVQLGPQQGLEKLAGKDAANGYRHRTALRNRADYTDKQEVQRIGLMLWKQDPKLTIAAIEQDPEMKTHKRRYRGRHTLRDWLKEIDPRPEARRRGRPRRN